MQIHFPYASVLFNQAFLEIVTVVYKNYWKILNGLLIFFPKLHTL